MRVNNKIKTQHIKIIKTLLKAILFIIVFLFSFLLVYFGAFMLNIQFDDDGTIKKNIVIAFISSIISFVSTQFFKSKKLFQKRNSRFILIYVTSIILAKTFFSILLLNILFILFIMGIITI